MPHKDHPLLVGIFHRLTQEFLVDYLRIVEPELSSHLALEQATFPDLSALPEEVRLDMGIVAEVPHRSGDGGSTTVLIQVEPSPSAPPDTSRRLVRRFLALETRLVQPVYVSVVYLSGGRPGPNLESAVVTTVCGLEVLRLFYVAFGLEHARADYYLLRPEPLAWALATTMRPLRYSHEELVYLALEKIRATDNSLSSQRRDLLLEFVAAADTSHTHHYSA